LVKIVSGEIGKLILYNQVEGQFLCFMQSTDFPHQSILLLSCIPAHRCIF